MGKKGMLRLLMASAACTLLLAACGSDKGPMTDEQRASAVAKSCYEALYDDVARLFLDGRIHAAEMPQSYREQLLEAYHQHVKQVNSEHQGVEKVEVSKAERDTTLQLIQVFLVLSYGDGTREEIVVPMVEHKGRWLMK
jgi:hypothetical protein